MKANEFFKAMGINAVRQFLENDNIRTKEMHNDLKRLVESHDLATSYNGLHGAKNTFDRDWWRSEDEVKQVVAALRQVFGTV